MNNYFKKSKKRFCQDPIQTDNIINDFFECRHDIVKISQFHELWNNWELVVGDLASFAKPLGVRGKTLCIGAENNFELQEISLEYDEILARANAFMKAFDHDAFFIRLELKLMQGITPIELKPIIPKYSQNFIPEFPQDTEILIDFKDEDLLAKCYKAYCQRIKLEKGIK